MIKKFSIFNFQFSNIGNFIKNCSGFTFLELLITISIISIVFGFVFNSFAGVQRSGRNTQRQSDLRSIQSALEQYNVDQTFYPKAPLPSPGSALKNPAATKTYLPSMPQDPKTAVAYGYQTIPSSTCDNTSTNGYCYNYCLYANLENQPTSIPSPCPSPPGYNFALTQP